jgi:hypothetical protein
VDGYSVSEDKQFVQIKFHLMRLGCSSIEKQDELHYLEFGIVYKMYNGRKCFVDFGDSNRGVHFLCNERTASIMPCQRCGPASFIYGFAHE